MSLDRVEAAARRTALVDIISERLAVLDPIFGELSGVQVTVRLREDGTVRVVVVEPELRFVEAEVRPAGEA